MDKQFKHIYKNIDKIHLHDFTEDVLRDMYQKVCNEKADCISKLKVIKKEIDTCLASNDGTSAIKLKSKGKKIHSKNNDLKDEQAQIWKALQEKILKNRLIEKFGSLWLVNFKEVIIMVLIIFVISLLFYDLTHPELSIETKRLFYYLDTAACTIFLLNFFYELRLADSKKWYWKSHVIDFVTSIPLPDLQLLRAGRLARLTRLARLARLSRVLRVLRVIFFFWRGMDQLAEVIDVKLMKKTIFYGIIVLVFGGFTIYYAEEHQPGVDSVTESIWWSFTTFVTGGFGDIHNPQSLSGRILTVILIFAGIILVGVFTATLTSILVADDSEMIEEMKDEVNQKLDKLSVEIKELKSKASDSDEG